MREIAGMDYIRLGYNMDRESGRWQVTGVIIVVMTNCNRCFVWPIYSQKLKEVTDGLEAAWEFFGSVPMQLVIANCPVSVARLGRVRPRLTVGFLEYSRHHDFSIEGLGNAPGMFPEPYYILYPVTQG